MRLLTKTKLILVALLLPMTLSAAELLPKLDKSFQDIKVTTDGERLIVENSQVKRVWKTTGYGLVTESITNLDSGKVWSNEQSKQQCDWAYYGLVDEKTKGKLTSLTAQQANDEGFTAECIEVVAEYAYPTTKSSILYKIWIYPNSSGLRTQAFIKSSGASKIKSTSSSVDEKPEIRLKQGKIGANKSNAQGIENWYMTTLVDPATVEFHAVNLDINKVYKVGISWWDGSNGGGNQRLRFSSVDGEARATPIPKVAIPDYKGKKEPPATTVRNVPAGINIDGSIKIYIDKIDIKEATISEIWLYEEGGECDITTLPGEMDRISQLATSANKGFALVAYLDCGVKGNTMSVQASGFADYLPIKIDGMSRRYMGYYNDTQNRNSWNTPIYREIVVDPKSDKIENVDWANILSVESGSEGVMMVKESHKCVNQYGVDTGEFAWDKNGVTNTGTSLTTKEIGNDYKWFWGSWSIVYEGGDDGRELALKSFDRDRFPVRLDRDMYSVMCTWGHSRNPRDGRNYAVESEILKELDFVAETGIDMLLIDDGWQVSLESKSAHPTPENGWKPYAKNYPKGWSRVVEKSAELDLRIGLWGIAQNMSSKDMIWNWDRLKMDQLKLDFASFGSHTKLDDMMQIVRRFILHTDHKSSISWDLTENAARYGYYWAREYGNLHFMNRKPFLPLTVTYIPSLSLRDFWLLSKYNNLNKYQLVIQNPEVVDKQSDAHKHSPEYCVATALMGIPEFMAVTRFYSEEARAGITELLGVYKGVREEIFTGYVFPIGDEPSNTSWTGFQHYHPDRKSGYLTLFRELNNKESVGRFTLRFFKDCTVRFTDLESGETFETRLGSDGAFEVEAAEAASYKFLRYEVL